MKKSDTPLRIFIDMDGTIANIHAIPDWWEKVQSEKDFFKKLEPFSNMITALMLTEIYYGNKIMLCSLSAVDKGQLSDAHEASKNVWLDENAYFIKERIFVQCGQKKSACVGTLSRRDILLDDYSKNLNDWVEDGGTAIKIRNGINCINGNWKGEIIYNQDSVDAIVRKLDSIIRKLM